MTLDPAPDIIEDEETPDALDGGADEQRDDKPRPTHAQLLVEAVLQQGVELFHHGDDAYALVPVGDHSETHKVHGKTFRSWARRLFYEQFGKPPGSQAVQDALNVLAAKGVFDGPEQTVHVRVAGFGGAVWVDLADERWRAVRIDADGWRVVDRPPVRFIRPRGLLPLPEPVPGGNIDDLRGFVNMGSDADFVLLVGFLVGTLQPSGPFPVLVLSGEQGSCKSTTCRILRALIDPNAAPLRAEPREARDLAIAACNAWVLAFDNISRLSAWLSDGLCRIATGGGFAVRELYTDDGERLFDSTRPVLANGIEEFATRPDLVERSIHLTLPSMPETSRRTEAELWRTFDEARPALLGALYDAVSAALRNRDSVELATMPRMADFAVWVVAAEAGFGWEPGTFVAAYADNRRGAVSLAVESSPVGPALLRLADKQQRSKGTMAELLSKLTDDALTDESERRQRGFPKTAHHLGGQLRRLVPDLRRMGVGVVIHRTHLGTVVEIERVCKSAQGAPPATLPPVKSPKTPVSDDADSDAAPLSVTSAPAENPLFDSENSDSDARGADDAEMQDSSCDYPWQRRSAVE